MRADTPMSLRRRALIRRAVRISLRVAAGLLVLLAALVALVAYQAANLVHAGAVAEARRFGERIGREVTVGPAHVELGAELSVQLDQVRVAAAPGQEGPAAEPLFEVAAVRVRVPAWSIVRSLGRDLEVRAIEARGPVIRLVRLAGGELSYADLVTRFAASEPPAEHGHRARVGRVTVTEGRVDLYDLSRDVEHGGVHLTVDHLGAVIPQIGGDAPVELSLDAAVLAPTLNFHLDLALAPLSEAPALLGRLRRAALQLSAVDVEPLAPFIVSRSGIRVASAKVSSDLALTVDPRGPIVFAGSLSAAALRLVREGGQDGGDALGSPVDMGARVDVTVDPEAPALSVRSLSITAGGMTLEGHADVGGPLDAPEVRALELTSHDVTFERLLAVAPPALLPAGLTLTGPLELRASAHGPPRTAVIDVAADLVGAAVTLRELHKPAGVALSAELQGRAGREGGGLTVDALGVHLGPLALTLRGWIRSATDLDLTLDSGEVGLDGLLRLFPAVARSAPAGTTLAGHVQASGHVTRTATETRGDARLALRSAAVKTKALTLEGAADLSATVRAAPGSLAFTFDLDAERAGVKIPGRLDKAAGSPLSVRARVDRAGAITTVSEARLAVAGLDVSGHARHDAATHRLTAEAPLCEIDLAALSHAVPALGALPVAIAASRMRAAVSYSGDVDNPGGAYLHLGDLDVSAPFGRVRGTLDLHGLSPPRGVIFDLRSDALDLDGLPPAGLAAGGLSGGRAVPALDTLEVRGKLHMGHLHARALDVRDLDMELTMERGALSLSTLRFSALGGLFTVGGSRADLGLAHGRGPTFALRARAEHVDLAALTVARGGSAGDLSGKLDATVSLDGAGVDWAAIAPGLAGTAQITVDGAHVHGKQTLRGTIINPLIGKIAEQAKQKHPVREIDTNVERATVALRVAGGKVTTTAPLTAKTDEGTLTMDGTVGFDHSLSILGSVVIPPAVIDKATKGLLVPYGDATVKVRIDGTTQAPRIELLDLEGTAKALRGSWIHGIARKVERAFGKE